MTRVLTRGDRTSWIETVWDALHDYRENNIPEGVPEYDAQWDEICTAMAWITEDLGEPTGADAEPKLVEVADGPIDWNKPLAWSTGEPAYFAPYDSPHDHCHRDVSSCQEWERVTGDNFVSVNADDGEILGCEGEGYPRIGNVNEH